MNTLDFSVILVNWNTADLTCRAIDSVLEDANHSNLATEVLVVDNGSTEGSVEAIRANHPGIEILENTLNLGFARAVNRAVWKATGEFILLLNTDAILRPGALAAFKSAFDGEPQIGIAGGA
ncbi:MAG: glycosyltransferase, partial [Candidatus Omnitrophica bacterium]|nr:glycosyltransferase [Candidatus Omnitrophota bacterium]